MITFIAAVSNVTFAPGSRDNWLHIPKERRTLYVVVTTVIKLISNIGTAISNLWFTHLAVASGSTTCHDPVNDQQYISAENGEVMFKTKGENDG